MASWYLVHPDGGVAVTDELEYSPAPSKPSSRSLPTVVVSEPETLAPPLTFAVDDTSTGVVALAPRTSKAVPTICRPWVAPENATETLAGSLVPATWSKTLWVRPLALVVALTCDHPLGAVYEPT
jgi:hypothetical protein